MVFLRLFFVFGGDGKKQFVRVANQKEGATAARTMVEFVQSTIDMVSMNMADSEKNEDPYDKAIGGETRIFFVIIIIYPPKGGYKR